LRGQLGEARREIEEREGRFGELQGELTEAQRQRDELGKRIFGLQGELTEAQGRRDEQGKRISELEWLLGEARHEAEERGRRSGELVGELAEAQGRRDEQGKRISELEWLLGEARHGVEMHGRRIAELEGLLGAAEGEREDAIGRGQAVAAALGEAREQIEQARSRIRELEGALDAAEKTLRARESGMEELRTRLGNEIERSRMSEAALDRLERELGRVVEAGLGRSAGLEDALGRALQAAAAEAAVHAELGHQLEAVVLSKAGLEVALEEAGKEMGNLREALLGREEEVSKLSEALEVARLGGEPRVAAEGRVAAMEAALAEEQATRQEVEHNLEVLEVSLAELSRLGEMAVRELDAARQEAASHAAETASWKERCEELKELLDEQRSPRDSESPAARSEEAALRQRLQESQAKRLAAEAEQARLQRLAREAHGHKDRLASAVEAAREVQDQATAGMTLVIGRLEAERERADALEREAAGLRKQLRERTDQIVALTREAALEADRARSARRELASYQQRIKQQEAETASSSSPPVVEPEVQVPSSREPSLDQATVAARQVERGAVAGEIQDQASDLPKEREECVGRPDEQQGRQSAAEQRMMNLEAEWRVAQWDRALLEERVSELLADREPLLARQRELETDLVEARSRYEGQVRHVAELREGALRHRREMADREVALAEAKAWNSELSGELRSLQENLARQDADRESLARQISDADERAKLLAAERARLQGELERCERELDAQLGQEARASAPSHRLSAELQVHASRIEDLETVLDALRAERQTLVEETTRWAGENALLKERLAEASKGGASQRGLDQARARLSSLETLCLEERARLGDLAEDLRQAMRQAKDISGSLAEERATARRLGEEKALLEVRAAKAMELELELDTLRSQPGGAFTSHQALAQLASLQQEAERQAQATEQARERVRALNNVIGDREAEVLLLNAQVEKLQRRAAMLLAEVRRALGEPGVGPEQMRAVLGNLGRGLEELI
ncbi:MAG: hypothetical protein RBU30_15085, partial [Polyangia bacterium]|nr:hypothetical protein [Polyangia bacterium]